MSRKRKVVIAVGLVALIGLLAFLALRQDSGEVVEVRAAEVGHRDLTARVASTGHIEPKRSVDISADVSGRIVQLPVEEGQDVQVGDLLLVIDPTQFQAEVQRARAALSQARAEATRARASYTQARRDADRLEELQARTRDLVTAAEVEQAVTEAEVAAALQQAAQHAVEQAEARLDQARDQVAKTTIRAPMSGRITRLNVEQGETAIVGTMNNPGSLLLTIADLSVMEAVMEVDETDVPEVSVGDSASVEIDAFPNRRFAGRVTKIGNSSIVQQTAGAPTSQQAVDFEVRVTLTDPPESVRPDLSATADIITATREEALAIPITALTLVPAEDVEPLPSEVVSPDQRPAAGGRDVEGVFVVEDGRARFRPVRVGIAGDEHFEVLAGLEAGERVVSGSYQAIRELEHDRRVEVTTVDTVDAPPPGQGVASDGGEGGSDG